MSRQRRPAHWRRVAGRSENYRGPRCALSLDEQLEIQRLMREATPDHKRARTAMMLATRYGVSSRTIWRYSQRHPTPVGLEYLRMRLVDWARERQIGLTSDDVLTLLLVVARHRETTALPTERSDAA